MDYWVHCEATDSLVCLQRNQCLLAWLVVIFYQSSRSQFGLPFFCWSSQKSSRPALLWCTWSENELQSWKVLGIMTQWLGHLRWKAEANIVRAVEAFVCIICACVRGNKSVYACIYLCDGVYQLWVLAKGQSVCVCVWVFVCVCVCVWMCVQDKLIKDKNRSSWNVRHEEGKPRERGREVERERLKVS